MVRDSEEGLTLCEMLFLERKRKGLSQEEMGNKFSMTRQEYGKIERGEEVSYKITCDLDEPPTPEELCVIYRRRSRQTQAQCAKEAGVTRYWFNMMEIGKAPSGALVRYWGVKND